MSKKKKGSVPVAPPKKEKKMVIDMNAMNLKKEHTVSGFRTGGHMTEKDRPRPKGLGCAVERKTGKENTREAKSRAGIVMISDPALLI